MLIKRSLSAVMVASLALPAAIVPSTAFAEQKSAYVGTENDSIDLIVRAVLSKSPNEARALLDQAKKKAVDEKLPQTTLDSVNVLLSNASKNLALPRASNPLSGGAPTSFRVGEKLSSVQKPNAQAPVPVDRTAVLANLLSKNPDLHATMSEIMIGRLKRDSTNLEAIAQATSNQSIKKADAEEAKNTIVLDTASGILKTLRDNKLLPDWGPINKALRAEHESLSVDAIALSIIEDTTEKAAVLGFAKKVIHGSGISVAKEALGSTGEALVIYAMNANLVLRLADLYGMNLTESEKDVAILTILPVAKVFLFMGKNRTIFGQMVKTLAGKFAEARANPAPGMMPRFFAAVFSSNLMTSIASKMGLTTHVTASKEVVAQSPEAGAEARAGAKLAPAEAAVVKLENVAAAAEAAAIPAIEGAVNVAKKIVRTPMSWRKQALWITLSTFQSTAETGATGMAAMWFFKCVKQHSRALETADFHRYLMQDNGRGLFKLLIATMNNGPKSSPAVIDIAHTKDKRAAFIMNIARSVKICSPQDKKDYASLVAEANASRMIQIKDLADRKYRLLRFACTGQLGDGRYDEIAKEFLTFNGIAEGEVAFLSGTNYPNRIQMGELLMQLMFLDGEPTSDQMKFFRTILTKYLGLERLEDIHYFSRLYGFIRVGGGMVESASSPTGFTIDTTGPADPFSNGVDYTTPEAPDFPAPPPLAAWTVAK